MPHAAIKQQDLSEDHAISVRPSGTEVLEETTESDARGQLRIVQNSTPGPNPAAQREDAYGVSSFPTAFLIDKQRQIVYAGPVDETMLTQKIAALLH